MPTLADLFEKRISAVGERLSAISEEQGCKRYRDGDSWTRKEVLGHLLDSATNNRVRFATAAIRGAYTGTTYDQLEWVAIHGYKQMPWNELFLHWRLQNELLARLVRNIPESSLNAECRIGTNEPVTLRFLIEDYVAHMEHHTGQITG